MINVLLLLLFSVSGICANLSFVKSQARAMDVRCSWLGVIGPGKKASIRAKVFGDVLRKHYRLGSVVKKNDRLLEVQGGAHIKAEQASQTAVNVARKKYENAKSLCSKGYASRKERDEALAAYKVAEAQYEEKMTLSKGVCIRAPFDGVVCFDNVDEGSVLTTQNAHVCDIAVLDNVRVRLMLSYDDARYISEVKEFEVVEDNGHTIPATLYILNPSIDAKTGGVNVELLGSGKITGFFGATVRVHGVRKNVPDVHVVSYNALHFEDGKIGLLALDGGIAHFYPAKVISIYGDSVYLTNLPKTLSYVAAGHAGILHGERVDISKCHEKSSPKSL